MRAKEFITEAVNPQVLKPGFEKVQDMGNYTLRAYYDTKMGPEPHLRVDAIDRNGRIIGYTYFQPRTPTGQNVISGQLGSASHLEALGTKVEPGLQRQGVASGMYNFARRLGNQIKPSTLAQTPAGQDFWARGSGGLGQISKVPPQPDVPGSAGQPQPAAAKPTTIDVPARTVPDNPQAQQLKPAPGTAAGAEPGTQTKIPQPSTTTAAKPPGGGIPPEYFGVKPGSFGVSGGGGAFGQPGPKPPYPGKVM